MAPPLLIRHGRFLIPESRARLRRWRVTRGSEVLDAMPLGWRGKPPLALGRGVVAVLGMATDPLWLPLARRLQRDQRWWVVEVREHGPDLELVRIAEAADLAGATARRAELEAAASPG